MSRTTVVYLSGFGPRARLDIGDLTLARGLGHELDAAGFDRHSFLCGQSGSGKTYALGVMLERLLTETDLRLVVLDPNSDFVRLGRGARRRRPGRGVALPRGGGRHRVHSATPDVGRRLRLMLRELEPDTQAALLRLDPIADRDEYAELAALLAEERPPSLEALMASKHPDARKLATRVRNLGADRFGIWAHGEPGSVLDAVEAGGPRCVVVDLGSLPTPQEQSLVAAAVLGRLWRHRQRRGPCSSSSTRRTTCARRARGPADRAGHGGAVRIAAEGRKFGLYLLVSTQRPQKVHENVISQADNLVLMRLNSAADAAFAQDSSRSCRRGSSPGRPPSGSARRSSRGRSRRIPRCSASGHASRRRAGATSRRAGPRRADAAAARRRRRRLSRSGRAAAGRGSGARARTPRRPGP